MKTFNLLAYTFLSALFTVAVNAQSLKPGTVTFQNINGEVVSQNINTGLTEEITEETILTEGFVIKTNSGSYLDIVFSNGVVGRLSPNSTLEIESFATNNGRRVSREDRMNLSSARSTSMATSPALQLNLRCGDFLANATEKAGGEFKVKTPLGVLDSENSKFFVSHGGSNSSDRGVTRTVNLGSELITMSSNITEDFVSSVNDVSYGHHDGLSEEKSKQLFTDETAIILAEDQTPEPQGSQSTYNTYSTYNQNDDECGDARYTLIPYDQCYHDRLGSTADHILNGGTDPLGYLIITGAEGNVQYFNVQTGETGSITPGMTLPEGSIVRTAANSSVTGVLPNGTLLTVEPNSNVFVESVSSQHLLSNANFDQITNVLLRVESGKIIANTSNTPAADTLRVISPLDSHIIPSDALVSVEFTPVDTTAFQTITRNQTPAGSSGVSTTVVSSDNLSFLSDAVTFIEFAADGESFSFSTPPAYTHITESAIIPPNYDFIDRTLVFAAPTIGGPTPLGTPGNPGNILTNNNPNPEPESP